MLTNALAKSKANKNQEGMPMRFGIVIGIFLTATGTVHSGQQHPQEAFPAKIYSVCEVLEQVKALNGMMIAVRGVIVGGGHGSFLSGSCSSHFTTKDSHGQLVSFGFGPGSDAPAQLVVKTVLNPSVLHSKK